MFLFLARRPFVGETDRIETRDAPGAGLADILGAAGLDLMVRRGVEEASRRFSFASSVSN